TGLGKLPDALRRELPALAFGGASYSSDAASRMVIFNGRVFHEGDTIAPQLVLQQIKLKAAVLAYKGYRYEMAY
ncbi:MAG: general secretion pathway protein GspB, partial [Pseudomonadota bacterium]|nr:general secretion pathway protein GspB [Pseudomonadota bacterium]